MTLHYEEPTVSKALPLILKDLLDYGDEVGSRNGRVKELLNPQIVITDPVQREILSIGRKANVFAQIAETMWVLSGRNDVEWLSAYLPRAKDYSDDGVYWRGGYGPRIRGRHFGFDQLSHVVDILKEDPLSRRAVLAIYDPQTDAAPGKDIPCNDFLQFQSRGGYLHLTVTVRSNDAMWGWSGINAFEWSTLQEIVASLLGVRVGNLVFNIGSLHLYEPHWAKASRISYEDSDLYGLRSIRFNPDGIYSEIWEVDLMIERWFLWESMCRTGTADLDYLDEWDDPLFTSWAKAIAYFWTHDPEWLCDLRGTALGLAVARTPASVLSEAPTASQAPAPVVTATGTLSEAARRFYEFVADLHAVKHASYGDSWKKRGEKMSILANIARKVDRLGVGDRFDTSADTLIDFLVYLIKYRNWILGWEDTPENMNGTLERVLVQTQDFSPKDEALDITFADILHDFDYYAENVDGLVADLKIEFVDEQMYRIAPIALDVWHQENEYRGADRD